MDCTQAIDFTQSFIDSSINDADPIVAGWIEVLGMKYELKEGCTRLGRDPESCKIVLANRKTISKEHALFEVQRCHITVCDLGSRNKTKMNNMYLKPNVRYALQGEEKLIFGDVCTKFIKNENTEISDSDSETLLSTKYKDANMSDDVYVPETPNYQSKNSSTSLIPESPIPESQDCFANETRLECTKASNSTDQGVGIVCFISKMPKISDEYNSDESTDIEDFLESYKVSHSPNTDSKTSDEKDAHKAGSYDAMQANSSETVDLFELQTQIFRDSDFNKSVRLNDSSTGSDVLNTLIEPGGSFELNSMKDKKIEDSNKTQYFLPVSEDGCNQKLFTGSSRKKLEKSPENDNKAEKFTGMETSQSLLNEVPQSDQAILANTSEDKITHFSYDSMEELFPLIKREKYSEPEDCSELKLPLIVEQSCTVPVKNVTALNSHCHFLEAATQIPGADNAGEISDETQPTQIVQKSGAGLAKPCEATVHDSTQDILNVFNDSVQTLDNDKDDSIQNVLDAFNDREKSFRKLNVEKCPIKVRKDLVPSTDSFDVPTQPVLMNTTVSNRKISLEENIYTMPTQALTSDKNTVLKLPSPEVDNCEFDMPTQCITNEAEFDVTISTLKVNCGTSFCISPTHSSDRNSPMQVIHPEENVSSEIIEEDTEVFTRIINTTLPGECSEAMGSLNEDTEDVYIQPTQIFIQTNPTIDSIETPSKSTETDDEFNTSTQNICPSESNDISTLCIPVKISDEVNDATEILPHSKYDLVVTSTQNDLSKRVNIEKSNETEDVYNAATQNIPSEFIFNTSTNDACAKRDPETLQTSKCCSTDINISDCKQSVHCLSDESTDIEEGNSNYEENVDNEIEGNSNSDIPLVKACNTKMVRNSNQFEGFLSNSSIGKSCAPTEIEIDKSIELEISTKENNTLNNSSCALQLSSPEALTDVSLLSDDEKITKVTDNRKICELRIGTAIASSKNRKTNNIKDILVANKDKHKECNNDSSEIDSLPSKSLLNKSKTGTVKISGNRKSRRLSINVVSDSGNYSFDENNSNNNNTIKCKKLVVDKKNITRSGRVSSFLDEKNDSKKVIRPSRKKDNCLKQKQDETPRIIAENASTCTETRSSRRSKPPVRYSPDRFTQPGGKDEKKLPIKKRSLIEIDPIICLHEMEKPALHSRNIRKKLQIAEDQENLNQVIKANSPVPVIKLEKPIRPTRQSCRGKQKSIDPLPEPKSKNTYSPVIVKNEVDESYKADDKSVICEEINMKDDPTSTTHGLKRKTRSVVKNDKPVENKNSPFKILKVEQSKPSKRGRAKKNILANCNKLQQIKEFNNNYYEIEHNSEIPRRQTRSRDSNISDMGENTKFIKSEIIVSDEIHSKLKRKRSSRSISPDSSSSVSSRRKSARAAVKSIVTGSGELAVPKVMFTGYKDENDEKIVRNLGGELVESVKDCSILVTTAIKRTCKLIAALGKGATILSPDWLKESKKAGYFLETTAFFLSDKQTEEEFGFSLLNSTMKARSSPLFLECSIHATKSVKPTPEDIKEIVECAKGTYLKSAPKKYSDKIIIVSCVEDKKSWASFKKLKIPIVGIEFILTGLLKQQIMIDENLLF